MRKTMLKLLLRKTKVVNFFYQYNEIVTDYGARIYLVVLM